VVNVKYSHAMTKLNSISLSEDGQRMAYPSKSKTEQKNARLQKYKRDKEGNLSAKCADQ
jgi:hypothetical protein